jgi:predicted ABC-type ATPase
MARLRIFAGPNGSGKSTLNEYLRGKFNYGSYINADEIKKTLDKGLPLLLSHFKLTLTQNDWIKYLNENLSDTRIIKSERLSSVKITDNSILSPCEIDSYSAAIIADFLREELVRQNETFSFETVFSHTSKIDFIKNANKKGYRSYLYFIATSSPNINVMRIENRVLSEGHSVPKDKIIERYERSLENLLPALREVYRAYIFDNSGENIKLIAELTSEKELNLLTNHIPEWFMKCVINKLK